MSDEVDALRAENAALRQQLHEALAELGPAAQIRKEFNAGTLKLTESAKQSSRS